MDVKFNIDKLTAKQMTDFFRYNREQDFTAMAEIFASGVVSSCPKEWGDPSKPETFSALPYFSKFKKLIELFVSEAQVAAKN